MFILLDVATDAHNTAYVLSLAHHVLSVWFTLAPIQDRPWVFLLSYTTVLMC